MWGCPGRGWDRRLPGCGVCGWVDRLRLPGCGGVRARRGDAVFGMWRCPGGSIDCVYRDVGVSGPGRERHMQDLARPAGPDQRRFLYVVAGRHRDMPVSGVDHGVWVWMTAAGAGGGVAPGPGWATTRTPMATTPTGPPGTLPTRGASSAPGPQAPQQATRPQPPPRAPRARHPTPARIPTPHPAPGWGGWWRGCGSGVGWCAGSSVGLFGWLVAGWWRGCGSGVGCLRPVARGERAHSGPVVGGPGVWWGSPPGWNVWGLGCVGQGSAQPGRPPAWWPPPGWGWWE